LNSRPPRPESLLLEGPTGRLELVIDEPVALEQAGAAAPAEYVVVCHPHPLHGGTLSNKVVHTVARAFQEQGFASVRFNFRGVGRSEGQYDQGRGETEDALAVVGWAQQRWPNAALNLAGFSFGSMVALLAAARTDPLRLISVAPPVSYPAFASVTRPRCPWLIVQGDADELVDARAVQAFAARLSPPVELRLLAGVGHFFHGHLHELQAAVASFIARPDQDEAR
jgi:uncharacterized protein